MRPSASSPWNKRLITVVGWGNIGYYLETEFIIDFGSMTDTKMKQHKALIMGS